MAAKSNSDARRRAEKQLLRRARGAVKNDLGWLRGVPVMVDGRRTGWLTCPPAGAPLIVDVDGARLSRAFRTLTFITKRHPELVGQLVDQPEEWVEGIQTALGHLQRLVHENQELASHLVGQLRCGGHAEQRARTLRRNTKLCELVDDVSWLQATAPRGFGRAIGLIESEATLFASLTENEKHLRQRLLLIGIRNGYVIPTILRLIVPLRGRRLVVDPGTNLRDIADLLRQIKNGRFDDADEWPDTAPYQVEFLHRSLDRFTDDLLRLSSGRFQDVVSLPDLILGKELPTTDLTVDDAIEDAHRRATIFVKKVGFQPKPSTLRPIRISAVKLAKELEALAATRQTSQLLEAWKWALQLSEKSTYRHGAICRRLLPLIRTNRAEPEAAAQARLAIARYWMPTRRHAKRFDQLVESQRALLKEGSLGWSSVLGNAARWDGVAEEYLLSLSPLDQQAALRLLSQMNTKKAKLARPILCLIAAGAQPERARELAESLTVQPSAIEDLGPKALSALLAATASTNGFCRMIEILRHRDSISDSSQEAALLQLLALWRANGLSADDVLTESTKGLAGKHLTLCEQLCCLNAGQVSESNFDVVPAVESTMLAAGRLAGDRHWQTRYPKRFHPLLNDLSSRGVDPNEVAHYVLGKSYPDPEERRRQLEALDERIAMGGPAHLIERRARLVNSPSPEGQEFARLERKLRRRIATKLMESLQRALERAVEDGLAFKLRLDVAGLDSQHRKMVDSIGFLPQPYRSTALEVVASRLRGEVQDWRRFEANVEFAQRAEAAGVDLAPWGTSKVRARLDADPTIKIFLETDPYEVLQMGRPFGTCLAPGRFNFWSAVVNAVDLNKAVLVGRNASGEMVARCLLALDRNFALVAYHPYAHESSWNFKAAVAAVVKDLAAEMGTVVAPSGQIREIVFPDWYDDGPVDLHGQLTFTQPGSTFMTKLADTPVKELIQLLDESDCRADDYVHSLLENGAFSSRPDLLMPVFARLSSGVRLPFFVWHDLASSGVGSDDSETVSVARTIARTRVAPGLLARRWRLGRCCSFLAELDPVLALRIVRRTRPTGIRRDDDEVEIERRRLLSAAHRKLGREQKAERLNRSVQPQKTS